MCDGDDDLRDDPAVKQATATALYLARGGDITQGMDQIRAVCASHGPTTAYAITLMLCDTFTAALGIPDDLDSEAIVAPRYVRPDTGAIVSAEDDAVPPSVAWAGALVAARASGDLEMYNALMGAIPAQESGTYIAALLYSVAITMNHAREQEARRNASNN